MTDLNEYMESGSDCDSAPPLERLIDVTREPIRSFLKPLLKDRTSKGNIKWGTDAYSQYGYDASACISEDAIISLDSVKIVPRIEKSQTEQQSRTRNKAEVFTPVWICNLMNNHCDQDWFGRPYVFNHIHDGREWTVTEGIIPFPDGKKWKDYVDSRHLEITCGEAPFLVSRYDASTGDTILPLERRIGVFDRKMRIVDENTDTIEDWLKWSIRALESCYGYEYQGDSLLIARCNMFLSFIDYYEGRWGHQPDTTTLNRVANVVSWNLWQMDGLKNCIPFSKQPLAQCNLSMFGDDPVPETKTESVPYFSKIYDWRRDNSVIFDKCKKRGKMDKKLFDYVIGNPPYQLETVKNKSKNNQKSRTNIFHYFQMAANDYAGSSSVLIYPGGRWIHRSGKGVRDFGIKQINDIHLSELHFYPDSTDLFPKVTLDDGVSIVIMDYEKNTPGFDYYYHDGDNVTKVFLNNPGESLFPLHPLDMPIANKIELFMEKNNLHSLHERIESRSLFGIESDFISTTDAPIRPFENSNDVDYNTEVKLYVNDKAGVSGRAKWFVIPKDELGDSIIYVDKWKVIASSAHPAGAYGRERQLEVVDNHSAFGRSKIALGLFDTEIEAKNYFTYLNSKIIHYAFLLVDESLSTLALKVPDIGDYSGNGLIDFSADVDEQLISLLSLTDNEIERIYSSFREGDS